MLFGSVLNEEISMDSRVFLVKWQDIERSAFDELHVWVASNAGLLPSTHRQICLLSLVVLRTEIVFLT